MVLIELSGSLVILDYGFWAPGLLNSPCGAALGTIFIQFIWPVRELVRDILLPERVPKLLGLVRDVNLVREHCNIGPECAVGWFVALTTAADPGPARS